MTDGTRTPPSSSSGSAATRRGPRFARLPEALLFDEAVPHQAVRLWGAVNRLTAGGNAYAGSWADLATALGWSRDSAKRAAHALADAGWASIAASAGVPGVLVVHEHKGEQLVPDTAEEAADPVQMCPDPDTGPGADVPRPPVQIRPDPGADSPRPPLRKEPAREERERGERTAARRPRDDNGGDQGPAGRSAPADPSPMLTRLGQALLEAGMPVQTERREGQTELVERLVAVHGIPALVRHARAQYRPERPAASMAAFVAGWAGLPEPRKDGPLTRPGSDDEGPPLVRVATEDRAPEVVEALGQVRATLRQRRTP